MISLNYPRGAAAAIIVTGVRDQRDQLVSDAAAALTLTTLAGAPVEGAAELPLDPVEGEPGTYEAVLPHTLNLLGTYRVTIVLSRGAGHTPITGLLNA